MEDEDAWKKLPTDQKVQHKSWKARAEGYKECMKNFRIWDEGSPEFNKYLGLVKKFVTDPNELVRIQGLEAVLIYVENAQAAKKTCGEVVSGIVLKCLNTKPRLKEAAISVCLMYVEIDKNEALVEELIKGFSNKQPKVATACLEAVTMALNQFGSKVIQVKPLLKEIPKLADHRDKNVREAVKALAVEIYRWAGPAIKTPLQAINAVMLKELEEEWSKADASGKPVQSRFMRSQQDLREKMEAKAAASATGGGESGGGASAADEQPELDPYDLMDPVEILSKLPKNFYEQIEAKKWQERKEMLEACQKLCESPKIEPGDFGDLVRALRKVIAKDTNVMLVTIAAKCVAGLAKGIRKKFQPFASSFCDAIFEKFKEKKPTVVAALQDAVDAIYLSTTMQTLSECIIESLDNKNPNIREQTGLFLARALAKTKASALNKATIKPLLPALLKNIDHSAPNVRDAAYKALGMLLKLVGERIMMPFIADLDNLKMEKIKEYAGKAEIKGKSEASKSAPAASAAAPATEQPAKAAAKPKVVKGGGGKKTEKGGAKKQKASKQGAAAESEAKPQEPVLSDLAVEDLMNDFLTEDVQKQLGSMNWKERLEGLQSLTQKIKMTEVKNIPCQAIVKTLGSGKPGWKDNNFNCLNTKFAIVKSLAETGSFSQTSADVCVSALIEKIGDVKCGKASKEAITAIAEATSFPWVSDRLMEISMSHKNPKIQSESLSWLSEAIKEFGMAGVNVKLVIAKIKIGFAATNPAVRTAAFSVMSTMTLYIGPKIRMFFENEKPALLQQIDAEIEKCKDSSPPAPTKGLSPSNDGEDSEEEESASIKIEDLVPRVNIADRITEGLITKLSDKNWKLRKEALEEVTAILNEAKFVEPTIGELAPALKLRLADSNKILVNTTLTIITQLATALGPHCPKHVKTLAPGLVGILADAKPNVRQAGLNSMNEWLGNTNLSLWFEDEIISTALSVPKYTFLRIELLNWLAEKLIATPKLSASAKEGLEACVKHLYACCEDRTGDVRAKAQAALPGFMYHLGIDKMTRMCGKLSPSSMNVVTTLLEKAKDLVPARKAPASKKAKPAAKIDIDIDVGKKEPKETASKTSVAPKQKESTTSVKGAGKSKRPASSKKAQEEPEAGPALVKVANGKEQRIKDEQKLKTLKWIFDAPREELTSQLKTQLQPCVSSALATEMFHADFQHHIKALTILTQAMEQQWDDTVGTLDLILRWITLRFYEKNTTVHMKCLEYLKTVFKKLENVDFRLTDSEATSFIPHLITKIGEPKENIRKDVHTIMQQTTRVYPAGKVFGFLMQGLGTKNSRQKTECLDELGILISSYGIDVCQPTPPKALREVATHIGDRDNSVRSAALNVIVAAYNSCGDIVYKYVGKLNEKDMSMLEERIKRSGKFTNEPVPVVPAPTKSEARLQKPSASKTTLSNASSKPDISTSDLHSSGSVENEIDERHYRLPELLDTECADLLNEPDREVPRRFTSRGSGAQEKAPSSPSADATLNAIITSLASSDIDTSLKAAHQLDEILSHHEKQKLLKPRIDQILTTSCIQIRLATNRYLCHINVDAMDMAGEGDADHALTKVVSLYKSLLAINYFIFKTPHLALLASQNALQDYTHALLVFLLDKKVNELPECQRFISSLNVLVTHMVQNTNPTYFRCALVRIVLETMEGSPDEVRELLFKCVWKSFKNIEKYLYPAGSSLLPPLQPAAVLAETHNFFIAYPITWAARSEVDKVACKTVRSVVTELCKALGNRIFTHVKEIDGVDNSDLMTIITMQLKTSNPAASAGSFSAKTRSTEASDKKENVDMVNGDVSPARQLSLIVKKVGNREQTKQGMQELYDFKLKYPDYDIESGFTNMTPLFLNYIKRSLASIEEDRAKGVSGGANLLKSPSKNLKAKDYFERIKLLRAKCGLPVDHLPQSGSESRILSTNSNALNQGSSSIDSEKQLHAPVIKPVDPGASQGIQERPALSEPAIQRPSTASNVEELKRRLEKIKRGRKRN